MALRGSDFGFFSAAGAEKPKIVFYDIAERSLATPFLGFIFNCA
jgi:hypothetical protein